MEVIDIPIDSISAANWNPNEMDQEMLTKLYRSVELFGMLVPLVVREVSERRYETIGGAHRLIVVRRLHHESVPCIVVQIDDAEARLLSQALNHIAGQDNPGLRGEVLRQILESTPERQVAELIPGSFERLKEFAQIGQEDLATYLQTKRQASEARLEQLTFQLSREQLAIVRSALRKAGNTPQEGKDRNPNQRGNALASICKNYLDEGSQHDQYDR